jgi:hypothetical protein
MHRAGSEGQGRMSLRACGLVRNPKRSAAEYSTLQRTKGGPPAVFPAIGIEAGNHVVTHAIDGLPEANPIFRQVYGWDSSLRVPFFLTHAFLGDKPTTIDFSWRTRYLSYAEPFTDYVSGVPETLAKHPQSYWRGDWIVPFSQLAQFKVTVQHGGLPPDFDYLGYSVNVGLTLGNPGYTEH